MRFTSLADWLSWQETLHPRAIDLSLDRLTRTLARLRWQRPQCPVITVGGTNGKGSSVALCARILTESGYRVGTFTSPHLVRYQERIVIAGQEVSATSLMVAFERIDAARDGDTLTFFEFNTLAALLVFETAQLDAIVLEVGMGGRLDGVNIVDADVALVTSIALDHCEWLGNDVESIGREKAGIFRPDRPAVFGAREMPASIASVATDLRADLRCLGRDFDWSLRGDRWSWRGRELQHDDLPAPALHGEVQYDNAASVLAVLECLSSRLPVTNAAISRGLTSVHLPGRFQRFHVDRVEWILDVAHNPAAARSLAAQLAAAPASGRTIAVCGILADKDIDAIVAAVRERFDAWIAAGLAGPRALDASALAARLRQAGARVEAETHNIAAACAAAARIARAGDRVVVFGSFLTVGPAIEWLQQKNLHART